MKKVLVTGANGYIGRHALKPLLDKGYEVHARYIGKIPKCIPANVNWVECNLFNFSDVSAMIHKIQPTHLLHFA